MIDRFYGANETYEFYGVGQLLRTHAKVFPKWIRFLLTADIHSEQNEEWGDVAYEDINQWRSDGTKRVTDFIKVALSFEDMKKILKKERVSLKKATGLLQNRCDNSIIYARYATEAIRTHRAFAKVLKELPPVTQTLWPAWYPPEPLKPQAVNPFIYLDEHRNEQP